ncbi:hypothetical protein [uncultured Aquimonas sp.]|uniref:hypothetical protein n=1 Tax=uncultured Aquimonas sp. TaxID=385483 RepID=UPI00086987A7|nr:hypothetical protein [uncultured Aquimonas sp.]ODU46712.1 MAG: hypothetical protein ABS96_08110 [Xanthomonadaceae bacterium SCN 69-123]
MKSLILAVVCALGFSAGAFAAQHEAESASTFTFATAVELKASSPLEVDAYATGSEICWATYTACMLSCGYYDPAQFPVDACSESCFNEYLACAGF